MRLSTSSLGQPFYGWWDFALRSVGARHAVPKGWPFNGWSAPHRSFLVALGSSQRPSGAWGGTIIGRADGRSPSFSLLPRTPVTPV